ncbi:MAG: UDP-2,4-diacetamido-2,4,6-trideoxy-beta-L-altropyranose hydrolase [Candidatus Omnitrophica bacterium]|nr:UDP-2,4-diacetamido-2,4,6-trideoxy-beta-L-altropyranose hydrolase [Candidatus Omnitrophota bacterium]
MKRMAGKRAAILTEGGRNIGLGHLTRCLALAQGVIRAKFKVKFIVNGDKYAGSFLKKQKMTPIMMNWLSEKNKIKDIASSVDFVIVDSYKAPVSFYKRLSQSSLCSLAVDDYNRIVYPTDIVVSPSVYGDRLNYTMSTMSKYLLGKEYIILRKEFWKLPKKRIKKSIKDVFIFFGGKGYNRFMSKIISRLSQSYPGFRYHLVSCNGKKSGNFCFYPGLSAEEIRDLMSRCDLAISGGGQTLYELARMGVPTIGICFADNQKGNLEGLRAVGALHYAGRYNSPKILEKVEEAIKLYIPQKTRERSSILARETVDAKGVERIIKVCMDRVNSKRIILRLAQGKDCRDLWLWRKHFEVRRWCLNKEEIKYPQHRKWFVQRIKSRKTVMYIAENKEGIKIGQTRFEIEKKSAYINVNLNPLFFGKGLGNKIIGLTTNIFMKQNPRIKKIIAEIAEENIASEKAFVKAGYEFSGKNRKNGRNLVVFEFIKE